MGEADHTHTDRTRHATATQSEARIGSPYDNGSVAERLGGEAFTTTLDGMVFDGFRARSRETVSRQTVRSQADPAGTSAAERPVAVLVHGWPQFAACWEDTAAVLLAAGIDVIAYDQRGYSPGARPGEVAAYDVARLVEDLDGLRAAWGLDRFHLVGHDWGGIVGWSYAALHPESLATLTSVSTAHPIAHATRIAEDPDQYERMHYMRRIREDPAGVEERMLARGGAKLAALYDGAVAEHRVRSYIERFSQPAAPGGTGTLEASLMYYRAFGGEPRPATTPVTVPTLYVWGSEDLAFTRGAAELTGEYVDGDYRFVELTGASHWLPEQEPDAVAGAVIDWVRAHP